MTISNTRTSQNVSERLPTMQRAIQENKEKKAVTSAPFAAPQGALKKKKRTSKGKFGNGPRENGSKNVLASRQGEKVECGKVEIVMPNSAKREKPLTGGY